MLSLRVFLVFIACFVLTLAPTLVSAQRPPPPSTSRATTSGIKAVTSATPATSVRPSSATSRVSSGTAVSGSSSSRTVTSATSISSSPSQSGSTAPDVHLNVPDLSVKRIELVVENLRADINLNAQVASLVSINAGVMVSVQKINVTIADVEVKLELIVRLGRLVDVVHRVFESLDLNPLLIDVLNTVGDVVVGVIGAVDGLLGSITGANGGLVNFLIDNLGNIVQSVTQVAGGALGAVDQIVGNYLQNMTAVGSILQLGGGQTKQQYSYSPLNALVDIVFNSVGQIVQATVAKPTTSGGAGGTATGTATRTSMFGTTSATPMPVTLSSAPAASTPVASTAA